MNVVKINQTFQFLDSRRTIGLRLEFDKNLNSIEMLNCKIVNVDKLQDNLRSKNLIF